MLLSCKNVKYLYCDVVGDKVLDVFLGVRLDEVLCKTVVEIFHP